jgi:hypothetical protein
MHLKGYDEWKTRSDLDDADRWRNDERERCFICDAPLPEGPWSFWSSDGVNAGLCDDCAPEVCPDGR